MALHSFRYANRGSSELWNVDQQTYQRTEDNSIVETRPFTQTDVQLATLVGNAIALDASTFLNRVGIALSADTIYLNKVGNGTATQGDAITQVAALTRQVQALMIFSVFDVDAD